MEHNANPAPVVYVIRVANTEVFDDSSSKDRIEEILCSGSVYASLDGAKAAVLEDVRESLLDWNDEQDAVDEVAVPEEIEYEQTQYLDYADKVRTAWLYYCGPITTYYRIAEVELHD